MRILLDEENLSWDEAWEITKKQYPILIIL